MLIRCPANRAERREVLGVLLSWPGMPRHVLDERIDVLESYAQARSMSLDECLCAVDEEWILAATLCLDSPGRTSTLLLSPGTNLSRVADAVVALLAETERRAISRHVQLLQGMVPPDAAYEGVVYSRAGFTHLARLIYLQSELSRLILPDQSLAELSWENYRPETHALFAGVIEGTYTDSLDCGSLNGLRSMEDILASHRATGQFEPLLWQVGLRSGQPVGVLLLAYMEEHKSLEVVYMGCLPECRRRGHGAMLLRHAVALARERGIPRLTLSVDEKNVPARKLYGRFGFGEVMRRDVWMKVVGESGSRK